MEFTRQDYKKGLITGILTVAGMFLLIAAVDNFDTIKAKAAYLNAIFTSHIYEQDADAGVTIDGVLLKDGAITGTMSGYQTLSVPAAAGNLAALNISGQSYDSGYSAASFMETTVPSLHGNLALLTAAGAIYDSGVYIGDVGGAGGAGGVIYEATIGTAGSGADYICDGTADQTEFATAIAALADGDDIRVLPGTYKFSDTLTIDKALNIDGGDRASTTIQIDGNFRGIVCTDSVAIQHITLTATANQTLDDWPSEYVCPLVELKASGCIINGNAFLGGLGVYAHCGYHRITENTFNNYSGASGIGLALSYADSMAVAPREGYIGIQPKYNVVERNIFGYGDYIKRGVYIENQVLTTSIANNFFKAIVGIESDSTFDYSSIKGNSLYCTTALIDLADSDNVVISDNISEDASPTDGIIIGGVNNTICNNLFYNVTTDYIRLLTNATKTNVIGNRALGTAGPASGISEAGSANYNTLQANANMGTVTLLGANSVNRDALYIEKAVPSLHGNLALLTSAGQVYDSGIYVGDIGSGTGDVVGPASSVNNQLASFSGVTGKLLQATALYSNEVVTAASPAQGDILYYNSGWQKLAKGTDGQYLKLASGLPSWAAVSSSGYGFATDPTTLATTEHNKIAIASVTAQFGDTDIDTSSAYHQGYWRFQDDGVDDVYTNDITFYNSPAYESSGKSGKAIDLESGSSQYGKITQTSGLLPTARMALSCWVKLESTGSEMIIARSRGTSNNNWDLYINSGGQVNFTLFQSDGTDKGPVTSSALSTGTWYHVVALADGSNVKLYVNGSSVGTPVAYDGTIRSDSGGFIWFGCNQAVGSCFDGLIDELSFWNCSISTAAITDLYDSGSGKFYSITGIYTLGNNTSESATSNMVSGWYEGGAFTRSSDSQFTVTDSATAQEAFKVGRPLRFADTKGTWSYAIVTAYSSGTVTIAGAPMTTSFDTYLQYGDMSKVVVEHYFISGAYADAANSTALTTDMNCYSSWGRGRAYLVTFGAVHKIVDATAQPKINVDAGGNSVSTNDSNNGVQLSTAGTWVYNSAVAISTTNYVVDRNESVEINVKVAGTAGDAKDLTVRITFIQE